MRRALALLALVAGTLVPAVGASAQDPGGVGIRLLEAPTSRQDDPRARRAVVDHVKPGTTFTRRFEVSNTTRGQRLIAVYAAAADVRGGQWIDQPGRTQNELSRWVTLDTANADLAPGATVQPRLTISVPANASAGERYAVVWAELPPSSPGPGGFSVVNRVGLRIYLSVGPGGEPKSDFVVESVTAQRDAQRRPVVEATVRNTGGRALDLSGNLTLRDGPNGLSAGPIDARLGTTLAIGATAPVTFVLEPTIIDGPWRARVELKSGTVVRAAEATITFPTTAGAVGTPVSAAPVAPTGGSGSSSALPWAFVAIGLLLVLAALLLLLLLMRRRPAEEEEPVPPAELPPLDDLLTELRTAEGPRRDEVLTLAASYGKDAILASPGLRALPVQTARDLGERVSRVGR